MPEPDAIFAQLGRILERPSLAGKRVIVTAGPTREPVDAVRFISNRSSGRMGVAIAAAAWRRGADVALVAGPLEVEPPEGVRTIRVESTEEMARAVGTELPRADALVMAAAPADFRPATVADHKIKKGAAPDAVALAPTVDILAETRGLRRKGAVIVGFALETNDILQNARAKLEAKGLDLIVVNDAKEAGAGFGVDTNRVTLIAKGGRTEALELMAKTDLADVLLDRNEALLGAR
jgi:phosphopantothenoylcysteine decarboxylase/phosphopantothenate--cysteine ligase